MVSGSLAVQRRTTLTWTVDSLKWYYRNVYYKDCKALGLKPKQSRPTKNTLPYDGQKREALVFQPDGEAWTVHVINVAEYYQNTEKFLQVLRSDLCL